VGNVTGGVLLAEALVCFLASAVGVYAFVRSSTANRLLDVPNERSSHIRPIPRGGGVVIVVVVVAAAVWGAWVGIPVPTVPAIAALVVAAVSAIDDLRPLASEVRLVVHFVCAIVAVLSIATLIGQFSALIMAAAVLWLVWVTNAYNFMDGIDGIAGVQAVITACVIAALAPTTQLSAQAVAAVAIGAASAGFLLHNWHPARVFMGDVGSAFLGFTFGLLTLMIARRSASLAAAVALSLWPFLFDTAVTLVRRARRRENLLAAHRSHLYQRLVIAGWSHSSVSLLYGMGAALAGAVGAMWADGLIPAAALLLVAGMAVGLWHLVRWCEA
jgi:UDP-N-acetylmuramyl pentapeptide phosphotransferase/UDP-N-acetylglucosamine-1-phosphate transferase